MMLFYKFINAQTLTFNLHNEMFVMFCYVRCFVFEQINMGVNM